MNVIFTVVWSLALPGALGFGLANGADYTASIHLDKGGIVTFRQNNFQVPFYNNILGYAIDITDDHIVISSGLFQTIWKCTLAIVESQGNTEVSPFKDTPGCLRMRPSDVGTFYNASATSLGAEFDYGTNVFEFNQRLQGTFAPWAFKSGEKYGSAWGASVAQDNGKVLVGCPGCTAESLENTDINKKAMSGLVFEFAQNGQVTPTDVSFVPSSRLFGEFLSNGQDTPNFDDNGFNSASGLGFGTSVIYSNNKPIASRSRSSRRFGRQNFYDTSQGTCPSDQYKPAGSPACIVKNSFHNRMGDAIDISNLQRSVSSPHGTNGGIVYGLGNIGYNANLGSRNARFDPISSPPQTPAHSRIGHSMITGYFYGTDASKAKNDIAMGAPGYGLTGAVLVFNRAIGPSDVATTGLRYDYKQSDDIIVGPVKAFKSSFGYALHSFALDNQRKYNHLAVGAPTYIQEKVQGGFYKGGAVFVYAKEGNGFIRLRTLHPGSKTEDKPFVSINARFGSAITSLDLDGDNQRELIVGAPFNQDGCPKFAPKSYCGALYVFDGKELGTQNDEVLHQIQVIHGKDIYSMLGTNLAVSNTRVYASAPGGFGRNGAFSTALLKGLRANVRDWAVQPRVVAFDKLIILSFTTKTTSVTVYAGTSLVQTDDKVIAGDVTVVNVDKFKNNKESFRVGFNLKAEQSLGYYYEVPDVYLTSIYNVSTSEGTLCTSPTATLCQLAAFNLAEDVYIQITRIGTLNGDVEGEAAKLLADAKFGVVQVFDSTTKAETSGSTVSASSIVRVGLIEPSDVSISFVFQNEKEKYKLGERIETLLSITNNRVGDDSALSVRVEFDNVFSSNLLDYSSNGTWGENIASSFRKNTSSGEIIATKIEKRFAPLKGKTTNTVSLNFQIASTSVEQVTVTVFVNGNQLVDKPAALTVQIDPTCEPVFESVTTVGVEGVLPGASFDLTNVVKSSAGKAYKVDLSTYLGYDYTVDAVDLDPRCRLELDSRSRIRCVNASTDVPRLPKDYEVDETDPTLNGCEAVDNIILRCQELDASMTFSRPKGPTFTNKLNVRGDIIPPLQPSLFANLTTYFSGTSCVNTSTSTVVKITNGELPPPAITAEGIEWWIIVLAVCGALLLALIIVLVLKKLGFFKRKKPPANDDNNELDEEVGGSVLRG